MVSIKSCFSGIFNLIFPEDTNERLTHKLSSRIDKQIKADKLVRDKELKVLLLGTGESGKSTIVKQMKIIHQIGFQSHELISFRKDILRNLIESMYQMLVGMKKLNIEFKTKDAIEASNVVLSRTKTFESSPVSTDSIDTILFDAIKYLWKFSGLDLFYPKLAQVSYILCQAQYFLDNIDRITLMDYTPTLQDILRARIKTTGISDVKFKLGSSSSSICLIDVGGQISERKKWIHCFENVTAIVFCVALSEYDQVLLEDPTQSRMLDSFLLFQSIVNSQWFRNTTIILFLNKIDVFKSKLSSSPLSKYFEDYDGEDTDFESAALFIQRKFLALNYSRLQIYTHWTCATDTRQIESVFAAIKDDVFSKALNETGIL